MWSFGLLIWMSTLPGFGKCSAVFCFKYTSCPFLISFWNSHNTNIVVSPYPLFLLFPWFVTCGHPHSKNVKNSRNKHFISLKLHSLCKVVKFHSILPNIWLIPLSSVSTLYMLLTYLSLSSHLVYQSNCCWTVFVFK